MIFTRIIIGLIVVVAGYYLTAKSDWLVDNFGRIAWFEEHLGTEGGSRTFYKILGVIVIVLGFMYLTGFLQEILGRFFAPLFGGL